MSAWRRVCVDVARHNTAIVAHSILAETHFMGCLAVTGVGIGLIGLASSVGPIPGFCLVAFGVHRVIMTKDTGIVPQDVLG